MTETVSMALQDAWSNFLQGVEHVLPRVLAMVSIVIVGWIVAALLGFVTRHLLGWVKFNLFAERTGAADLLKKTELPAANVLAGRLVFWLVWVGFLISGAEALGFSGMHELMTGFAGFLPRLGAALVILVVGLVAANFAWRATLLSAVNAQVRSARVLSGAVRFLVLVLAIAMALDQIAVARSVVVTAFAITFGAVMLGLAIALGVGGGPIAGRMLEQLLQQPGSKDSDTVSHL
ncbi:MAG: mechanosensitive ion channel family protein [Hyphomicrobiales bacterium]